jgi:hypothetical protein
MTKRILAYIDAMPPAISGQAGHNATWAVACALVRKFGLSESQAMPYMEHYNERCQPSWTTRELRHKLASANRRSY